MQPKTSIGAPDDYVNLLPLNSIVANVLFGGLFLCQANPFYSSGGLRRLGALPKATHVGYSADFVCICRLYASNLTILFFFASDSRLRICMTVETVALKLCFKINLVTFFQNRHFRHMISSLICLNTSGFNTILMPCKRGEVYRLNIQSEGTCDRYLFDQSEYRDVNCIMNEHRLRARNWPS